MKNDVANYKSIIKALADRNEYESLHQLFEENMLGFDLYSYFLILKQNSNKDLLLNDKFWQSKFSEVFVSEVISSHFAYSFFKSLFYKPVFFNPAIIDIAEKANVTILIEQLKIHNGYASQPFMNYLSKATSQSLIQLYDEFQLIKQINEDCK